MGNEKHFIKIMKDLEHIPLFHYLTLRNGKFWFYDDNGWSTHILKIVITEIGKFNTNSPTYCTKDIWANWLNLQYTLNVTNKHFRSAILSDSLYNGDIDAAQNKNKRIQPSNYNVFDYLHTTSDKTAQ